MIVCSECLLDTEFSIVVYMSSYANAGVDLMKIKHIHSRIGHIISRTYPTNAICKVLSGFGHYAGLLELGSKVLALHSDGVGTKILIACMMKKYDSVGIDCVAMNVNDIICVGAMPIAFVDYIALGLADDRLVGEIFRGLSRGAMACEMPIVGGETAIVPDMLCNGNSTSFDLVGTVLGMAEKKSLILGDKIREDDVILGVESNGLHSNGYTLARKVLFPRYKIMDCPKFISRSIGKELLRPTRIYLTPIKELINIEGKRIHGLAHITGGSFAKLSRLNKGVNYRLDNLPVPRGIFKLIQEEGKISGVEMYSTFNMGIGFCIILPKTSVNTAVTIFEKQKMHCTKIGSISKGSGKVAGVIEGNLKPINHTTSH
jgi:phosphoribosylformylglycinamidine cyclo-ligase